MTYWPKELADRGDRLYVLLGLRPAAPRNHLGHTEEEIADREEARRAQENENRHAVVIRFPDSGGTP